MKLKDLFYNQILPPSRLLNRKQNFIGREEYLEQIETSFNKENKQIVILSSFPGAGKSSIANEMGHRLNDNSLNQLVYWMRSDDNNLEYEFRQFAFNLKAITEDDKVKMTIEDVINQIGFRLRLNHMSENFLFILDNCDSIVNTKKFLDIILND